MSADAEGYSEKQLDALIDVGAAIFADVIDEGAVALAKIARIERIFDDLIARMPITDPAAPWDALTAIKKALR